MKLKVCGMKNPENIDRLVKEIQPDYMGLIFFGKSPRNVELNQLLNFPESVKKVGVFVNETIDVVCNKIEQFKLAAVQLHGGESAEYCKELKERSSIQLIKVFSVDNEFDFTSLTPFDTIVDYYLFDTKGKHPGGNGFAFDWHVLENYHQRVPFILSGGIGMEEIEALKEITGKGWNLHGIDVNSKFEIEPGLKDIELINKFLKELS